MNRYLENDSIKNLVALATFCALAASLSTEKLIASSEGLQTSRDTHTKKERFTEDMSNLPSVNNPYV